MDRVLTLLAVVVYLLLGQPLVAAAVPAPVTLNENCVVNVLNRTIQVEPSGQDV